MHKPILKICDICDHGFVKNVSIFIIGVYSKKVIDSKFKKSLNSNYSLYYK